MSLIGVRCLVFVVGGLLLDVRCALCVVCCWSFDALCFRFDACGFKFEGSGCMSFRVLFVVCSVLFVVRWLMFEWYVIWELLFGVCGVPFVVCRFSLVI